MTRTSRDRGGVFRIARGAAAVAIMAATAPTLGSCRPARTQMLVVLDTDIPECRLRDIHLRCAYNWDPAQGDPSTFTCDYPFRRGSSYAEIRLPGSFGVTGSEDRVNDPVTLVIDDDSPGIPALRRIVRVHFVAQRTTNLLIRLAGACTVSAAVSPMHPCPPGFASCTLSQSCEALGQTCGNSGTCRSVDIAPSELTIGDDAGLPDSSADDASSCGDS